MSERIIVAKWWTPLSKAPAARKTRRTADRYSDNRDPDPHGEPKEVNYQRSWVYYWLPESLAVTGKQTVESRRVGIYSGRVWHNVLQIKASFDPLRLAALRKRISS